MPQLVIEILGDASNLNRTFRRTEQQTQTFARRMKAQGQAAGAAFGVSMPTAIGASAVLLARQFVEASRNAQTILGQTSVAVKDAGLNWDGYAKTIEDASMRISKASAFDDEAVLQSFQVFVRGQKNVARSLQLTELAADVARGRYTDLSTATMLVNKAAMGQIGALRRAGIQIDKNATSAQALDALLRAYGGSAKTYADSAAGSADKLSVAWENLSEEAGGPLSDALANVADYLTLIVELGTKAGSIKLPQLPGGGGGGTLGGLAKKAFGLAVFPGVVPNLAKQQIYDRFFGGGGKSAAAGAGGGGFASGIAGVAATVQSLLSGVNKAVDKAVTANAAKQRATAARQVGQRNTWFDAMISRLLGRAGDPASLTGQIGRLRVISGLLTTRIAATKDVTRKQNLEDQLADVAAQIRGDQAQIAQNAADAAKAAADKQKEALQAVRDRAVGAAALAVQQAGLTASLSDDLAALRRQVQVLKQQGAAATDIVAAQQAVQDKEAEIAQAQKDRLDAVRQQKLDAAQLAVERAGLTDTLTDDLAALKHQLAVFRKQHASASDVVGVQLAIKDKTKEIADAAKARRDAADRATAEADKAATSTRKLFKHLSAAAFLDQFGEGLTRAQKRRLSIGLAMTGPGMTLPAGRPAQFTSGITIHGGVHMHGVQDVGQLENQIAKRAKARPQIRRGARG